MEISIEFVVFHVVLDVLFITLAYLSGMRRGMKKVYRQWEQEESRDAALD